MTRKFRFSVLVALGAMTVFGAPAAGALNWSGPMRIDGHPPFADVFAPFATSCASARLCVVAAGRFVLVSSDPAGGPSAWKSAEVDPHPAGGSTGLAAVSCPSSTLCVAVGDDGEIASSSDPTGGLRAWHMTAVQASLGDVSCASPSLCVAVDHSGDVWTSTNPTGGASTWTKNHVDTNSQGFLGAVSCASASLCAALDWSEPDGSHVLISTDSGAPAATWTDEHISTDSLSQISCPSLALCVVVGTGLGHGDIVSSTTPAGGAGTWHTYEPDVALDGVACESASLCFAYDGFDSSDVGVNDPGTLMSSTDPTGSAPAWHTVKVKAGLEGMSCPTTRLCAGGLASSAIESSTRPAGPASAWKSSKLRGRNTITGVACVSRSLCFAVDDYGRILRSSDPSGGPGTWTNMPLPRHRHAAPNIAVDGGFVGISCPSSTECVTADQFTNVGTLKDPTTRSTWRFAKAFHHNLQPSYSALSCGSVSVCALLDSEFEASNTTMSENFHLGVFGAAHPSHELGSFELDQDPSTDTGDLAADSCAASMCSAVGVDSTGHGAIWITTRPKGGRWIKTVVRDTSLDVISCPSRSLCVAGGNGTVLTSTHPAADRAGAWRPARIDGTNSLTALACLRSSMCVAGDSSGGLESSVAPTSGASAWTRRLADPGHQITALSCATRTFCIAADDEGNVILGK